MYVWSGQSPLMKCYVSLIYSRYTVDKYKHINTCGWMDEYGYRQITVKAQSFGNDET